MSHNSSGFVSLPHNAESQPQPQPNIHGPKLASLFEAGLILKMRTALGTKLTTGPHCTYQEVVGDIALLRFVRGAQHNVEQASTLYVEHLEMRSEMKMDSVRAELTQRQLRSGLPFHEYFSRFLQTDLAFGKEIRQHFPIHYDAGVDPRGDPIQGMFHRSHR
jgi:hypothetical protein